MTALLIASDTHVAGVLARPIGILLKTEGLFSTSLQCRLSVTEKCVIPAICEVFSDFARTINVGGDIRSESNQFAGGRFGRNGWGSYNRHQELPQLHSSSFHATVVALD